MIILGNLVCKGFGPIVKNTIKIVASLRKLDTSGRFRGDKRAIAPFLATLRNTKTQCIDIKCTKTY